MWRSKTYADLKYAAPSNVNALLLIEAFVDMLESPCAYLRSIPVEVQNCIIQTKQSCRIEWLKPPSPLPLKTALLLGLNQV